MVAKSSDKSSSGTTVIHHHNEQHHHKNGKKKVEDSWDAKMSQMYSTTASYGNGVGGRGRARSRPGPGSTMSCDSDIRFTRRQLTSGCKCGCAILAGFFVFLLVSGVCVYLGSVYLQTEPAPERIFRGMMRAQSAMEENPSDFKDRIELVFKRSELRTSFLITEILALDRQENDDMMIHFNVHFDPTYNEISEKDIENVLMREIKMKQNSRYLGNLTIDPSSLDVKESQSILSAPVTLLSTNVATPTVPTTTPAPPRRCSKLQLKMCQGVLPYNVTSYPNLLGHESLAAVEEDMIEFRELVDAECYRLAHDFVCQLLQPACVQRRNDEHELFMPCRSHCREFWNGCGGRLSARFRKVLDCGKFPEYTGPTSCRPKPECVQNMQANALSPRICDGVPDCEDLSDEVQCTYCPPGQMHCGLGRSCLPLSKRCDGVRDCPNGSDERSCLTIASNVSHLMEHPTVSPHQPEYKSEGYVIFNEEGKLGKLCVVSQNSTALNNVASSLCNSLTFRKVDSVRIKKDEEENMHYVEVEDALAPEISFLKTSCPEKKVMYVKCSNFDCGKQSTRDVTGIDGLGKVSEYGDWPWHAVLFREDSHVCDATLIAPEWLITTASCFQGQPKAEWVARLGAVRITSTSPWLQERRIVGMLKSPVEGSTIVLIRLEQPARMSDFVRPVCLPKTKDADATNYTFCNTLGWARNRDQMQRVSLKMTGMQRCENVSIATVNSLCTDAYSEQEDCNEEEFAGSPMVCLDTVEKRWSLIGVSNWRIACSKGTLGRPRMYDKITSNVEWIEKTIEAGAIV